MTENMVVKGTIELNQVISGLSDDMRFSLADVGAVGGIHKRWMPLKDRLDVLLFEPRDEPASIQDGGLRGVIYNYGLSNTEGTELLHVTKDGQMTSVLSPHARAISRYARQPGRTAVKRVLSIPVRTLDGVMDSNVGAGVVDFLKVDVQGFENSILDGAFRTLRSSVLACEIEVSFFERYSRQAVFGDIYETMAAAGFEFIDFSRRAHWNYENQNEINRLTHPKSGRLSHADAFFVLREDLIPERLEATADKARVVTALLLFLCLYQKDDLAARYFDLFSDSLGDETRALFAGHFSILN